MNTGRMNHFSTMLFALLLSGCGDETPYLRGSLGELLELEYTKSTLEMTETSLTLRFLKARGEQWDTVIKVAVTLADATVGPGHPLDLAEQLGELGQRGRVTRNVFNDDKVTGFPPLYKGSLSVENDPATSNTVAGHVEASFVVGSEFGCGRAVFGDFSAEVVSP